MVAQKKQIIVQKLTETLAQSPNFVIIGFEKTPHRSLEELRKKLSPFTAKFKVIKNTLLEKAVNRLIKTNTVLSEFKKKFLPLQRPSALLTFTNDWNQPLKIFYDFIKQEKTLIFKSGIIDGQIYNSEQLLAIAQLPNKDQLATNIIGALKNPFSRFVFALKFTTNKFIYLLQIMEKKGGGKQ